MGCFHLTTIHKLICMIGAGRQVTFTKIFENKEFGRKLVKTFDITT